MAIKVGIDALILFLMFNYHLAIDSSLANFLIGCSVFSFVMSTTLLFRNLRHYDKLIDENTELDNQLTLENKIKR